MIGPAGRSRAPGAGTAPNPGSFLLARWAAAHPEARNAQLRAASAAQGLPSRDAAARAARENEHRCRVRHRLEKLLEHRRPAPTRASQVHGRAGARPAQPCP